VVTYTGNWPAPVAEVKMVAAKKFPPADVSDLIIGENISPTGESLPFQFYLKPGTFKLLGVAWREQNSTWDLVSVCGLHFTGTDSLAPGEITVATDTSTVKGINIGVNRSKARRVTKSKITGSIQFEGTWPDSIEYVYAIASAGPLSIFPRLKLPTLLDLGFSAAIPPYTSSYQYSINAFPATFYATGLIFFRKNQSLSADDINFSLRVGALNFTQYEVLADSMVAGPDFQVKFE